jgi:hypothetical protein
VDESGQIPYWESEMDNPREVGLYAAGTSSRHIPGVAVVVTDHFGMKIRGKKFPKGTRLVAGANSIGDAIEKLREMGVHDWQIHGDNKQVMIGTFAYGDNPPLRTPESTLAKRRNNRAMQKLEKAGVENWSVGRDGTARYFFEGEFGGEFFRQDKFPDWESMEKALDLALKRFAKNPPATEIYRNVIEIRAEKKDGKRYVHKFGKGSSIYGLPNGDILIASRQGKKLWKNFEQGRK